MGRSSETHPQVGGRVEPRFPSGFRIREVQDVLTARGITKRFGDVTAVRGLDLEVGAGELVCLLGSNGAGKTTTVQLFLGFLRPEEGEVRVDGLDPAAAPTEARRRLGYIPENVALYPELSGLENLSLFARLAGQPGSDATWLELLTEHGLPEDKARRRVATYSKGMRQKVGLAVAAAKEAKALLLDEPMSGLDPKAASEFTRSLLKQRELGRAILMTTHDIFRAKEVATRLGIMKAGELVALVDADDVDAQEVERIYLHHMHEELATSGAGGEEQ